MPDPIRETQVPELVFITIPCLKFWAQTKSVTVLTVNNIHACILYTTRHLSRLYC